MKVKVLFFAALREQLGRAQEEIDLPDGTDTVDGLISHLRARGGAFERIFSGKALVRAAVSQEMAVGSVRIKAGDEVAFFPPVTGG